VEDTRISKSWITALGPAAELQSHSFNSLLHSGVSFKQNVSLCLITTTVCSGMCAFGIIIGDTIPHVIRSIFPSLPSIPVLRIFANRQFIISLCTVCVSYPLSLYRDIHKLSRASGIALIGMMIIVGSVLIEGSHVPQELKGDPSKRFTVFGPGFFQAVGVISFAFGEYKLFFPPEDSLMSNAVSVPSQLPSHLWKLADTYPRSVRQSDPYIDLHFTCSLHYSSRTCISGIHG
jgi:hypothetical protein